MVTKVNFLSDQHLLRKRFQYFEAWVLAASLVLVQRVCDMAAMHCKMCCAEARCQGGCTPDTQCMVLAPASLGDL